MMLYERTTVTKNLTTITTETTISSSTGPSTSISSDAVASPEEDDDFIVATMAAVVGTVMFITFIIIIAFVIRSRHRRSQNLRRYHERQQRPASLEILDREDHPRETVNGVNNAMYADDSRLAITVHQNNSNQDQTDHTTGTPGETNLNERLSNISGDNSPEQQDETSQINCDGIPMYENTKISNQMLTPSNEQPNALNVQKAKFNSQERIESGNLPVDTNDEYETAFPALDDMTKKEYENIDVTGTSTATKSSPSVNVKSISDNNTRVANQHHMKSGKVHSVEVKIEFEVKNGNVARSKSDIQKPAVKPKPKDRTKRFASKSENEKGNENELLADKGDESHNYENSSIKLKKTRLQQAKLLKSVPPPCNTHPYINIPDILPPETDSNISFKRQSSEYEDSESVLSLQKHAKFKLKSDELKCKDGKTKAKQVLKIIGKSERTESTSNLIEADDTDEAECKHVPKETALISKLGELEAKEEDNKPEYANITKQIPFLKKDGTDLDYENEDTIKDLKSTLKRLGKRGFSTSSLETCKQERILKSGFAKKQDMTRHELNIESDDEYLQMDAVNNDDVEYLQMDAVNEDVYMPMVSPEEGIYMKMERNLSLAKSKERKDLQSSKGKELTLPKGHQTAPKPCGWKYATGYVNFSDQPLTYVNFFRSRSTDNVYVDSKARKFKF